MASVPTSDWAWPALIQSLQRDILHLREVVEQHRHDSDQARDAHRRELDSLIQQLRELRNDIEPVITDRAETQKLARQTRWGWIEKAGWVLAGGIAIAAWDFIKRHLHE